MSKPIQSQLLKLLFLCALFIFSAHTLVAQTYVPKGIALERLEVKLADVYKDVQEGVRPAIQKEIATQYINYAVEVLESNTVAQAIQIGYSKTSETFTLEVNLVTSFREELETLLKQ